MPGCEFFAGREQNCFVDYVTVSSCVHEGVERSGRVFRVACFKVDINSQQTIVVGNNDLKTRTLELSSLKCLIDNVESLARPAAHDNTLWHRYRRLFSHSFSLQSHVSLRVLEGACPIFAQKAAVEKTLQARSGSGACFISNHGCVDQIL